MKSLKEQLIGESDNQPKLKHTGKYSNLDLLNVDGVTLWMMAEMALAWLKNPDKSASFFKGDGGQTVHNSEEDIKKVCTYIIDNYDDVINEH